MDTTIKNSCLYFKSKHVEIRGELHEQVYYANIFKSIFTWFWWSHNTCYINTDLFFAYLYINHFVIAIKRSDASGKRNTTLCWNLKIEKGQPQQVSIRRRLHKAYEAAKVACWRSVDFGYRTPCFVQFALWRYISSLDTKAETWLYSKDLIWTFHHRLLLLDVQDGFGRR